MQHRRFFLMFLPFLALLYSVLLVVSGFIYHSFFNTLTQEVESHQLSMITATQKYLDSQETSFIRIALSIDSNNQLKSPNRNGGGYDVCLAQQELVKLKAGNDFLSDIAYYPMTDNPSDYLFNTVSSANFDLFFDSICRVDGFSAVKIKKLLHEITKPTMLPFRNITTNSPSSDKELLYIYPFRSGDQNLSAVIFFIRGEILEKQISTILSGKKGYVYILDQNGSNIISISCGESSISLAEMLSRVNWRDSPIGASRTKISGEDFFMNRLVSPNNEWSYLIITECRQFMEKVYSSRATFSIILFTLALAGSSAAFFIALQNYLPLRALAAPIKKKQSENGFPNSADEINCIAKYIDSLSHKNQKYEIRRVLWNIILGKSSDSNKMRELLKSSGLLPDVRHYRVLVFFCDSALPRDLPVPDLPELCESIAAQSGFPGAFGFEETDGRSFPLLLGYNGESEPPSIRELVENVAKAFSRYTTFTVGIGAPFSDVFQAAESFRQASSAIYYRVIRGKNSIIDYRSIETTRRHYAYPFEYEQELTSAIKRAKAGEITTIMQKITEYIENSAGSPEFARYICMGVAFSVVQTLEEIQIDIHTFDSDESTLYISPYEPVGQFTARVNGLCVRICGYIVQHRKSHNIRLAQKAEQYLRLHFSNSSLTLNDVAEYCGISASYLSRFFKEQFGESPAQFIDGLRMEHAKKLLSGTDRSLKEIVVASGYGSETNFIRKFKKKEGVTPIRFRELSHAQPLSAAGAKHP